MSLITKKIVYLTRSNGTANDDVVHIWPNREKPVKKKGQKMFSTKSTTIQGSIPTDIFMELLGWVPSRGSCHLFEVSSNKLE